MSLLLESLPGFCHWYEELATDPVGGFSLDVLEFATRICSDGMSAFNSSTADMARRCDELVSTFMGDYCDIGPGRKLLTSASESMLNVRNYMGCLPHIERILGENEAVVWWKSLLQGRPLVRDASCFPYGTNDEFVVSWATSDEVERMIPALRQIEIGDEMLLAPVSRAVEAMECVQLRGLGLICTTA